MALMKLSSVALVPAKFKRIGITNSAFPRVKFFALAIIFLGIAEIASGQATGDYRTNGAGTNWSVVTNWERWNGAAWAAPGIAGYPGQLIGTGTVTILTGQTMNANVTPGFSVGNITTSGTAILNINPAITLTTTGALTIDGTSQITGGAATSTLNAASLSVPGTATNARLGGLTITVSGATTVAGTITFNNGAGVKTFGGAVSNSGSWTSTLLTPASLFFENGISSTGGTFTGGGATFDTNNQSIGGTSAISFNGKVTVTGVTVTNNNSNTVTMSNTGAAVLSGTGTFTQGNGSSLSYAGQTLTVNAFNASANLNTVNYTGSVNPTTIRNPTASTYYHLTYSGSTTGNLGASTTVSGNLTTSNSGILNINGAFTVNVSGNLTMDNTSQVTGTAATSILNVNTNFSVPVTATNAVMAVLTTTITGTSTVAGTLTLNSDTGIKTFTGAVSSSGSWTSTSVVTTGNLVFKNGVSSTGTTFAAGTANFNTTAAQSLGGTAAMSFANIVTVGAGVTVTNNNTNTVTLSNAGVALASGGAGSTFTQGTTGNTLSYAGSSIGVTAFNATGVNNTVIYTAAAPIIFGNNYYNLTHTGTGTVTVAGLNITGSLTESGTGTINLTGTTTFNGGSTAAQDITGPGTITFVNLTLAASGTFHVNVNNNISISTTLTFTAANARLLVVGANGNVTLATGVTINNFDTDSYVQLDGSTGTNSNLIFTAPFPLTYPIGTSSGGYTPVTFASITTAPAGGSKLSVKAIYNLSQQGQLRRTFRFIVTGNGNATFFTTGLFKYNNTTDISSGDAESNYTTEWYLSGTSGTWVGTVIGAPTNQFTVAGGSAATASLATGTYYYTIGQSSSYPNTWYSYQTGVWSNWQNWTSDPSGSSLVNGLNLPPQPGDAIVILNGITITNDANGQVATTTTINSGGTLDMSNFIGNTLGTVSGTGTLRIKGVSLPTGTYTSFVSASGGTFEFYDVGGTLPTTQVAPVQCTFNNLKLTNSAGAINYLLINNLTINGNLNLSTTAGTVTWQINNTNNTPLTMSVAGDMTVASGGIITTGTGNSGNTQHTLSLLGNFTNNGLVHFYDTTDPALPLASYGNTQAATNIYTAGLRGNAVTVTCSGPTSKTVTCNNITDFYRFVVNKGSGQQAILTVNGANSNSPYFNFRLFGPTNQGSSGNGTAPNEFSANALSIINGTLNLTGSINVVSLDLSAGNDYFSIPQNGALWLNGAGVTVAVSDYNAANNFLTKRLMINGLLRVTAGTLDAGISAGIGSQDGGAYLQEGGTVKCWQFRPRQAGTGIFSFNMTGGSLNVGFNYAVNQGYDNTTYARFDLNSGNSTFQMSGGTINVAKPTNGSGIFQVLSSTSNYSVTGGSVNIYTGYVVGTTEYQAFINSTAPLYNVGIYRESGTTTTAQLQNQDLTVLNNLTINNNGNTPSLVTNTRALNVGGNFDIQNATTFTPGTSIITFNGTGAQTWTHNGIITSLASVVIQKTTGTILTLAGANVFPNITVALTLTSGTLADGGKTITVSGTGVLTNNATHSGAGLINYTSTAANILGSGGTFGNFNLATNATIATAGSQTITGDLRLIGASSTLNISSNALTVLGGIYDAVSPATTTAGFSNTKRIITNGLHNAGGLTRKGINGPTLAGDILFPVGSATVGANAAVLYTPITINVTAVTQGTITVRPVNSEHPNVTTTGQSLKYYWRVTSLGYSTPTVVSHKTYTFSTAVQGLTGPPAVLANTYRAARYDRALNNWSTNNSPQAMGTKILPDPFNTSTGWTLGAGVPATDQLDGEYTCGNIGAFGVIVAYYSQGSGAWNAAAGVWTSSPTHVGANLVGPPCATCPVEIGNGVINHSITIDADSRSCGTLAINAGSTLDCDIRTRLNFGTNSGGAVSGTGTLRIGSPNFPAGDFTNFIGPNGGTVEWYLGSATGLGLTGALGVSSAPGFTAAAGTYNNVPQASSSGSGTGAQFTVVIGAGNAITSVTVTQSGSNYVSGNTVTINGSSLGGAGTIVRSVTAANISYIIPATGPTPQSLSLSTYYNLVINPANTFTINLPPLNLNIYNNWTQQTGTGTVTNNGARTLTIAGGLTISSASPGIFSLTNSGNTTLSVAGNINVSSSGSLSTTGGTHTLTTTGGITNNGTINFNNTGTVALTFTGTNPVTLTTAGTGTTTLSTVTVNKGTSQVPSVTLSGAGTVNTTATTAGWLTLTNGSFIFNGNAAGLFTICNSTTSGWTIPPTANLTVQSGTVTIVTGNTNSSVVINGTTYTNNPADLFLIGSLTVSGGTVNVGTTALTGDNDIEYASSGTPTITVSGTGALNVNGRVRRSIFTLTGALVYNQSGGTVTVGGELTAGNNSDFARGIFEIDANAGSSFTMSGTPTVLIVQNANTNTTGTFPDLYLNPISSSVSSVSEIRLGIVTAANNFRVNVAPAIGWFTLNTGSAAYSATLYSNNLVVAGTLTINGNTTLMTTSSGNVYDVSIGGDLAGAGTYNGLLNTTTFNGTANQSAFLTATSQFLNMTINNSGGATVKLAAGSTAPSTLNNLNILSGSFDVNGLALNVAGNITNNSFQINTGAATGAIVLSSASAAHTITSSNGSFNNLSLGGTATTMVATVNGNMTITGKLDFTATGTTRYLFIGSNKLSFGSAATIASAGATRFIKTNGVSSDLGVVKTWAGATTSFTYAVGTRTNYTPVLMGTSTAFAVSSGGNLTVIPVDGVHPTSNPDGTQILDYYWRVLRDGTFAQTNNSGSLIFQVPTALIGGAAGSLLGYYLDAINLIGWAQGGTLNAGVATLTFNANLNNGNPIQVPAIPPAVMPAANGEFNYTFGTSTNLLNPVSPVYSRFGTTFPTKTTPVGTAAGGSWSAAGGSNWTTSSTGYGSPYGSVPSGRPVVILSGATINLDAAGQTAFTTQIVGGGVLVASTTGHSAGTISGTGTLRTTVSTLPAGTYTSFTAGGGGTIEYANTMTMNSRTTYNNLVISTNYSTLAASTVTMTASNLVINGDITIGATNTLDDSGNSSGQGDMAIAGNFTNSGTFNAGSSAVTLTGNLINSGTLSAGSGSADITGNLTNSGLYDAGSGSVNLAGNLTNSGTFTAGTGSFTLDGTTAQTITGATIFNDLAINNSFATSPQITISSGDQAATSSLTMTDGNVNLNGTSFTLGSSCASPGTLSHSLASSAGWMYGGSFTRYFTTTSIPDGSVTGYFPVGNSTDYRPFFIGVPAGDMTSCGSFTVSVSSSTATTTVSIPDATSPVTPIVKQYQGSWSVTSSGISGGTYDLIAGGTGFGIIGNLADLDLCKATSVVGTYVAATNTTADPRLTRTGLSLTDVTTTDGSQFFVGSTNASTSPLPIELLSFTGEAKKYGVDLQWKTASETNNDFFTVLHSPSGTHFESIGTVKGNGTTSAVHSYALTDYKPVIGKNYYELSQTDLDGHSITAEAIVVTVLSLDPMVSIYPNPLSQSQLLNVVINGLQANSQTEIQIVDLEGTKVNGGTVTTDADGTIKTSIALTGLSSGLYILKVQNVHYKFIIE